jgi:hypothetical protein
LGAKNVSDEMAPEVVVETPPQKRFITKEMAEAFKKINEGLALFKTQADDSGRNNGYISRGISNFLAPYTEIYTEKEKLVVQTSLRTFFKKKPDPPPTTSTAATESKEDGPVIPTANASSPIKSPSTSSSSN